LSPMVAPGAPPSASSSASSSALALARLGGRAVALLADEDERRLRLLDLDARRELTSAPLTGAPGHVIIDGAGRIYVAARDAARVLSFDVVCADGGQGPACAPELRERDRFDTPPEPLALGISRDGGMLLVACGWGRALVGRPLREGGGRAFVAPLAREPRGFALDKSGRLAIVAHAVGSRVSVVSLDDGAVLRERALDWRDNVLDPPTASVLANVPRHAVQGFAVVTLGERAIAPMVLAYPGDPLTSAGGYGISVDAIEPYFPHDPALVVLDVPAAAEGPAPAPAPAAKDAGAAVEAAANDVLLRLPTEVIGADKTRASAGRPRRPKGSRPCLLPRAAAVVTVRGAVLVACFDIGAVVEIGAEDGPLDTTERRRFSVGEGPCAIAIDPDKREAWVWSLLDRRLAALPLDRAHAAPRAAIDLPARASSIEVAGRRAFHEPVAVDGRSCASCHVDGRDDGLAWNSPVGVVQTPVLAGRTAGTAPHGWRGESATMEGHIKLTFERLRAKKPSDEVLSALARYIATMPAFRAPPRALSAVEARGREVFNAPEVACGACHAVPGVFTDGLRRDVGTGGPFDTPSLRFIGDTAPYMHDGRYATLRELLVESDGKMGFTRHLDDADMGALIAYLMTL
jgi:mono/diheme cytochrome c family protein